MYVKVLAAAAAARSLQSCPTLCDPIDGSHQAPPSLGFSRQEHWNGLPFPSPVKVLSGRQIVDTHVYFLLPLGLSCECMLLSFCLITLKPPWRVTALGSWIYRVIALRSQKDHVIALRQLSVTAHCYSSILFRG